MKMILFLLFCGAFLMSGCTPEKVQNPDITYPGWSLDSLCIEDFMPIEKGNFWIYEVYTVDTTGKDSLIGIDTLTILGDTLIASQNYCILHESHGFGSKTEAFKYLRDSSGHLVNHLGEVVFAIVNFGDTLREIHEEGIYDAWYRMMEQPDTVVVPAGKYLCLNYEAIVVIDKLFNNWNHPGKYSNYYAPGVGKVKSTAFYISKPLSLERRLIKFGNGN